MRRSAAGLALLSLFAMSLPGCGGDGSRSEAEAGEETRIRALHERLARAIVAADERAFCRLLAPNDRQRLADRGTGWAQCLAVWGDGRNPLFGADPSRLELEEVSIRGRYATAATVSGGELAFVREDGRWYLHLAPEGSR